MSKRILPVLAALVLVFACSFSAYAEGEETTEETTETSTDSAAIAVSDATLAAKLDTLQETLDKIAAAVAPAEGETSEESAVPDYSEQLAALAADVAEIKETVQATPETAEPEHVWDKAFADYTPVEGLLLVGVVLLAFVILLLFLR